MEGVDMHDVCNTRAGGPDVTMHPDELADFAFLRPFARQAAAALDAVAFLAEAHARVAGLSAATKTLGDLIETCAAAALADLPIVITPDSNTVEIVTGGDTDLGTLGRSCLVLEDEGWRVVALVPLGRLGTAHTLCRASGIARLQPYWPQGETVVFGSPEIP
jgi:hypothetical protein